MESPLSRSEFAWRIGLAFAIAAGLFIAWKLASVLLLVFGGILLAVVVRLAAGALARLLPIPERWAAVIVIIAAIVVLAAASYFFGKEVASQLSQLRQALPQALSRAEQWLNQMGLSGQSLVPSGKSGQNSSLSGILSTASATFTFLTDLLVVLFVAAYLSVNPGLYVRGAIALLPARRQPTARTAFESAGRALRGWLLGQLVSMLSVGLLTGLALWLVGVPLPLALGLLAGLLEFVPIVGPFAAAVPGILLGFMVSPTMALYAAGVYLVVQQLESNLITPLAQKWAVRLPPALGIIAIVAFGILFGLPGLLFATPLTVVIMVLVERLYLQQPAP
jgi:predicted PurR-regulated permease PerM